MSIRLDLVELSRLMSKGNVDALKEMYDRTGGAAFVVISNVDLASLVEEASSAFAAAERAKSDLRELSRQISETQIPQDLSAKVREMERRLSELEQPASFRTILRRIETLEAQV